MSNPEELPVLTPEEQRIFDQDMGRFDQEGAIPKPDGFIPVNLNDPTPRQKALLRIMKRAFEKYKEGDDDGKTGIF